VTPLKSHKNKNMNFKNIFGTKELGSFTIQSVSDCGRFVRFANGETTTRKHMEKNGPLMEWVGEDTFTLPEGWRTLVNEKGYTFFTEKEDNGVSIDSIKWK
jgi:hypothetical protein